MRRIVLFTLLFLAVASFAQIPVPQINLTGNIGCQGFPCVNTGTLVLGFDADHYMTVQETSAEYIKVTSSVSLTVTRSLITPSGNFPFTIENATTGGQSIKIIGSSGLGVTIANGATVATWNNGTDYVQVGVTGSGDVISFAAPSGSWPSWLVPTVTNPTSTPSLSVAASPIPNSALANSVIVVNGNTCTLGSPCSFYQSPPAFTWNIQPALFSTSTMLGPVYYNSLFTGIIEPFITVRLSGPISCSATPTVSIMDLGTSPSTSYGSATSMFSQATGTSDGVYQGAPTSPPVTITSGHYFGLSFSAGTCSTAPTIDVVVYLSY